MRNFWLGVIACLGVLTLMGATQVGTIYKSEQDIANEFQNVYLNMQPKFWRLQSSSVTVRDLGNKEVIIFQSTTTTRLYTKLNNQLYFINFSQ